MSLFSLTFVPISEMLVLAGMFVYIDVEKSHHTNHVTVQKQLRLMFPSTNMFSSFT